MSRCGECKLGCNEKGALFCEENLGYEQCVDRLQDALFELCVDGQSGWIPCSERLPSESDYYLVTLRNAFDDIGICVIWFAYEDDYSEGSEWREITDDDTVLAWMPLPKPWKGADDESN